MPEGPLSTELPALLPEQLRILLIRSLESQGFAIRDGHVRLPDSADKATIRRLHATAVAYRVDRSREGLRRIEKRLLGRFARGDDIKPEKIHPRLVEVLPDSDDELLFRYASLHWSIPVSSGYGRRIRFLVIDEQNDKLIGLLGLGDPVFSLADRDSWIGWDKQSRLTRLGHVMDAFVLGAVRPYSDLLCGKLVAMLTASDEVRAAFRRKYRGKTSRISKRVHDGRLVLVTTTSALGRSSLYNRLRYDDRLVFQRAGFTRGSGEFHFANGLYGALAQFAAANTSPTAKHSAWGSGFRSRREVVKKCLQALGLSTDWVYHGVEREIFVVPLADNAQCFLRGQHQRVRWFRYSVDALFAHFRERWLLPRACRDDSYRRFDPGIYTLWPAPNAEADLKDGLAPWLDGKERS